jgi:3-oxoacyl-[acyl-carrier protein] reductase
MSTVNRNQTVLVTGGSRGIGRGIVQSFLARGAVVAVMDVKLSSPTDAPADRLLLMQGDVSNADDCERSIAHCVEKWGGLDVLVNNAGIYPNRPVVDMEFDEWRKVLAVNLDGTFLMSRAYARRLIAAKQVGCIVNISSGAASSGRVGASHYCSSKAAIEMFTRVLAMELAPHHIRVNCIAPGLIDVRSEENPAPISDEYRRELLKTIPMGVAGEASDIGGVAAFLAGEGARYMTGSVVTVDGGSLAGRNQLPKS